VKIYFNITNNHSFLGHSDGNRSHFQDRWSLKSTSNQWSIIGDNYLLNVFTGHDNDYSKLSYFKTMRDKNKEVYRKDLFTSERSDFNYSYFLVFVIICTIYLKFNKIIVNQVWIMTHNLVCYVTLTWIYELQEQLFPY
jgi:hypothetical protein